MRVLVVLPLPEDAMFNELGLALEEELSRQGNVVELAHDSVPECRDDGVVLLIGDCLRLQRSVKQIAENAGSGSAVHLWQIEPLVPATVARQLVGTRRSTGELTGRAIERTAVKLFRNVFPAPVRLRLRDWHDGVQRTISRQHQGSAPLAWGTRRVERARMIIELDARRTVDRFFVSTPERRAALTAIGVSSNFVPLAHHPFMGSDLGRERDIDVLFLGNVKDDRKEKLRRLEGDLGREGFHLHIETGPLHGSARAEMMNRSKISLGLPGIEREFVRFRALCSMSCGALFVSERAGDPAPFVPGKHFVWADPQSISKELTSYLTDNERRCRITDNATEHLRRFTLGDSARLIAEGVKKGDG